MVDTENQEELPLKRTPWRERLIQDIVYFHVKTGMKYTTIGAKSIKNARMWDRLMNGGTITIEKADQIYDWMASQGYHFSS